MTACDIQCRLEACLELRRSLGFVVCYGAYALKELLQVLTSTRSIVAHPLPNRPGLDCGGPLWTCRTKSTFDPRTWFS